MFVSVQVVVGLGKPLVPWTVSLKFKVSEVFANYLLLDFSTISVFPLQIH